MRLLRWRCADCNASKPFAPLHTGVRTTVDDPDITRVEPRTIVALPADSQPTYLCPLGGRFTMAEKTDYEETVSREEAADLVQELAGELRAEGPAEVRVGNKRLTLSPSPELTYGIEVEERSPMLRGPREKITLTLEWGIEKES